MEKNLTLTGMMGVGKTTIGKRLAKKLKYSFKDIDKIIEKKEGQSIKAIFKHKGEGYFRKIEEETTLIEIKKKKSVISLGGGAFLNNSIRRHIKKYSISFWLDIPIKVLMKRLKKNKNRPLLDKENLNATIKKIYLERKKFYIKANYKVDCEKITIKQTLEKILNLYESSRN